MTDALKITSIKSLQNLIVELTKYEPNLTMKIWKMIAPPRHRLNQNENVKIVSLMPNPGDNFVHGFAFGRSPFLKAVFPKINCFYFDYDLDKQMPVYDMSVKRIESHAFMACSALETIVFPPSLKTFGTNILTDCGALKSVTIPKKIRKIPTEFCMGSGIKELFIPKNIKIVKKCAFKDCKNLKRVFFQEGTHKILKEAFKGCVNLSEVHLPKNTLEHLEREAFSECLTLESVNLCEPLETIERDCFYRCNLKDLKLPSTLKELGPRVFGSNHSLSKVNIPHGIEKLDWKVFHCCSLTHIDFPDSLKSIDYKAFAANKFEKVVFPPYLTHIENEAFFKCGILKEVEFPATIKKIGTDAFAYCKLKRVDLPTNFPELQFDWAFNNNNKYRNQEYVFGRFVIDRNGMTPAQEEEFEASKDLEKPKAVRKAEFLAEYEY